MVLERLDTGSLPMTEPHPAPFFDTGPHPQPLSFDAVVFDSAVDYGRSADSLPFRALTDAAAIAEPQVYAPSVAVPAQPFVTRWKFMLLLAGVWLAAAALGAGLYYWWFHAFDKTWLDAGVLLFVIVSVVAALLVSMAERAMLAASSLALLSAPFAAACGAAVLYGSYAFGWVAP